ncbi:MAG TPA: M81 family metallopeptidase [Planctomicrobium sp.]|nr:M81 family metallopeptidase [Planctomicrobium sp.]
MRVGIVSIQHESNTFIQDVTRLDDFRNDAFLLGADIREQYQHSAHEVGGFLSGLDEQGIEAVPILFARAIPGGTIHKETAEKLISILTEEVQHAGTLDGWLVAPHGAAVSELDRDFDGYWLNTFRTLVGPDVPVICTLDAHANLSRRMVDLCDATIVYRTNPHVDQRERGLEAARLMARTLRGEIRPTQKACFPPLAINIERQQTAVEPCVSIYRLADELCQKPGVLSISVVLGFPYADVEEMGTSFVVVTDRNPELAEQIAGQLADSVMSRREEFEARLISVEQALDQAEQLPGPVCLLDMGDNVGGGSTADGTFLLHALHQRNLSGFVCLYDPAAVSAFDDVRVGETVYSLAMGGKSDNRHGAPFLADVQLISRHEGTFREDQVRHGGSVEFKMGPTVVVRTENGVTIMLNSLRTPPFSLKQLTSCDVDPTAFQVIVAKGVQAPVAAYREVCPHLIRVNTQGVTSADLSQFTYEFRRQPLFPFERNV